MSHAPTRCAYRCPGILPAMPIAQMVALSLDTHTHTLVQDTLAQNRFQCVCVDARAALGSRVPRCLVALLIPSVCFCFYSLCAVPLRGHTYAPRESSPAESLADTESTHALLMPRVRYCKVLLGAATEQCPVSLCRMSEVTSVGVVDSDLFNRSGS